MSQDNTLSLFVFIDALGWELAQRHAFLDDLLPIKKPVQTIFGYSSTCDPTIFTGKLPHDHGHFAFFYYAPDKSPFRMYWPLRLMPKTVSSRGRIRAKMSQYVQGMHGYTGYFHLYNVPFEHIHLFDYSEKKSLFEPGGINGGQETIFDYLRKHRIPHVLGNNWKKGDDYNVATVEAAIANETPPWAYLFLGKLDGVMHMHGTQAKQTTDCFRQLEGQVRHVVELAKRHYAHVRLFLFSDHGMTDIHSTCDLQRRINGLGLRFGEDYAAVYDSTMARFWFLRPGAREKIEAELGKEPKGHIMTQGELATYGCDFPGQKYGELFFLLDPGVLLCPSFMGERPIAGMHGYSPEDKDSVASFMTNCEDTSMPRRLDDLYHVMVAEAARAAGLQPVR